MGLKIEIPYEMADLILVTELKECYENFKPENRPVCGMFSADEKEDLKEMAKMRKAVKMVLSWYGENDK